MGLRFATFVALIVYAVFAANASDYMDVPACPRPAAGTTLGACAARAGVTNWESSPLPLHRWIACVQAQKQLPSGGYGDAVFFSYLVPEWEKEIAVNLRTLNDLLSSNDRRALDREQKEWTLARERARVRGSKRPLPEGTLYLALSAASALDIPSERAIELACRIEKLHPTQ
jgi:hypothetical protein